jgi:protein-disulfide isomerase
MVRFDADMADELYLQRIREQIEGGSRSGVRATPTFFLNGRLLDVSYGLQALRSGIEVALGKTS